ncbi:hypothetical protein QPK87_13565 [Kamptonema cortianum]|nr:hypothetical protein [Geitlerinema splendidum]MDK3157595.1 hypothetical protein [Kamptonema cortianum]
MTTICLIAMSLGSFPTEPVPGLFSEVERAGIVAFWHGPGRYQSVDANPAEPFKISLSPEGSAWLLDYYKKRSPGAKVVPTNAQIATNNQQAEWDRWIDRQYSFDKAWAESVAKSANNGAEWQSVLATDRKTLPIPASLERLAGPPPSFVTVYRPQRISVSFDGFSATYVEGVSVRDKYPYFRSVQGVKAGSAQVDSSTFERLSVTAGLPAGLAKAIRAVSRLEGSFDSVNTYDSGGVSVGLVQFASLKTGTGPLARLLATMKRKSPAAFNEHFRRYGIDVELPGRIVIVDPSTGLELAGSDAVRAIIRDKRLTSVFHRAGKLSEDFRQQQLVVLRDMFDPSRLGFSAEVGGKTIHGAVRDIIQSESGIAALLDRFINTGSISPFNEVVSVVGKQTGAKSLLDLRKAEAAIVARMAYRQDFTTERTLSRPPSMPGTLSGKLSDQIPPFDPNLFGNIVANGESPSGALPGGIKSNPSPTEPTTIGKPPTKAKPSDTSATPELRPERSTPKTQSGPITDIGG